MKTKWFWGVKDAESKTARKQQVLASADVLDILRVILENDLASLEAKQESPVNYEKPAWTALQADYLATRRTLKEVIALLDLDQREE